MKRESLHGQQALAVEVDRDGEVVQVALASRHPPAALRQASPRYVKETSKERASAPACSAHELPRQAVATRKEPRIIARMKGFPASPTTADPAQRP